MSWKSNGKRYWKSISNSRLCFHNVSVSCVKSNEWMYTTYSTENSILSRFKEKVFPKSFQLIPSLISLNENDEVIYREDFQISEDAHQFNKELRDLIDQQEFSISENPYEMIKDDLGMIRDDVLNSLNVEHRVLKQAAHYFFETAGKKFRPMIVLLLGRACLSTGLSAEAQKNQRKLAEITEIIHVASLIHDDIIDKSPMRRGIPTLHTKMGSKVAVLAGDFLLARASISLAKIGNLRAVELMSTVIEHLAHGEILQMSKRPDTSSPFDHYMQTIFFKTSSLICNSCEAAATLNNSSQEIIEASYTFGKHLGIAYQLIDDILDFTETGTLLGKPSLGADLRLGIATSPVLYTVDQHPELLELIDRKFSQEGDVEYAMNIVQESNSISKTRDLAVTHCRKAVDALMRFPSSKERTALLCLVLKIMERKK